MTTDGWPARAAQGYITITAHYIDDNFEIQNQTLQTRQLNSSHTAENLAEVLTNAVEEWGLKKSQPVAITTDNASNIVSGISNISSEFSPHIRCFAHTLNLATQRAINCQQVDRVAGRIRRIVSFFLRSSKATAIMASKQVLLELPKHKLIQDVSTRWNSTYDMFSRYIEQQPAVFATLLSKDVKKNLKVTLSDDDLKAAEELILVLKPMKTLTTLMCDSKHLTISFIHPSMEILKQQRLQRIVTVI